MRAEWLKQWTRTEQTLKAGGVTYELYARRFAAGEVRLGPLGLASGSAMYTVIIKPAKPGDKPVVGALRVDERGTLTPVD